MQEDGRRGCDDRRDDRWRDNEIYQEQSGDGVSDRGRSGGERRGDRVSA